jgi:peptide/nickel transport system substrate-binding protein
MKKTFYVILSALLIASCSPNKESENTARRIFKYNELGNISSLDPAASRSIENIWAVNQLYNGLVQMNDSLKVTPCIAHSWEVIDSGLTYVFHLRNDVYFHDDKNFSGGKGRKVNANDFVFSFNRLLDPSVSSAISLLSQIDTASNKAFIANNDSTFTIHLKQPFTPFLGILTMKYFSVVPHEAVNSYSKEEFGRIAVGTGPFKFKVWKDGVKMVFVKNENYFEKEGNTKLPYLDAVSISFVKDRESSFLSFMQGDFDMVSGVDAINTDKVFTIDGKLKDEFKNKFILQKQPSLKTDYLGFLIDTSIAIVNKSPLRITALRQAINYGFDRNKMVKYLRKNIGIPASGGIIPAGLQSFDTSKIIGYSYNPEKVRKLLKSAGFPQGKGLPEIALSTTEQYLELAEYIQSQLRELGIPLKIEVQKASMLSEAVANQQINFFRKSWIADYPDEENFLSLFYSKNNSPLGFNYTHFKNEKFDWLYERAQREINDSIRHDAYQQMDQLIIDDAPIVPLYYDEVLRLVQPGISGLHTNAMNILSLKTVKKEIADN